MTEPLPPTLDPVAAARWQAAAPAVSPWLHEEVAQRMEERLQWMRLPPAAWCHWAPVRGGLAVHAAISARYPQAACTVYEPVPAHLAAAQQALARPWWTPAHWKASAPRFGLPQPASVQMLWANMQLHLSPAPQALIAQWQQAIATDGFLMFSCLGPDTLRELRWLYQAMDWPPAGHELTDMHDWGDMLVQSGFAEPVVDMERITLTFASPERALQELRGLGVNLHPQRFAGLRTRAWRARLHAAMAERLMDSDGQIALTFELIYGHAFKPAPRAKVQASTSVSLQDMRAMLRERAPRD